MTKAEENFKKLAEKTPCARCILRPVCLERQDKNKWSCESPCTELEIWKEEEKNFRIPSSPNFLDVEVRRDIIAKVLEVGI